MNICFTVLIGLPGSGKTTFARSLKTQYQFYDGKLFSFIHVCYDELISPTEDVTYKVDEKRWKDLRASVLDQIDLLVLSLKNNSVVPQCFRSQCEANFPEAVTVIIFDDNMYLRSMRYELFKKAKEHGLSFCQVYLKCTVESAVERNFSRTSDVIIPLHVITRMNEKIEPPKTENKWEKYSLVIDAVHDSNKLYIEFFSLLNESLKNPLCPINNEYALIDKQKSAMVCLTNVSHQSDIVLRHIISSKIQTYLSHNNSNNESSSTFKKYLSLLRNKKSKILCDIRTGVIQLPGCILMDIEDKAKTDRQSLRLFLEKFFTDI